jgi:hypothetical protein
LSSIISCSIVLPPIIKAISCTSPLSIFSSLSQSFATQVIAYSHAFALTASLQHQMQHQQHFHFFTNTIKNTSLGELRVGIAGCSISLITFYENEMIVV